MVSRLPSMVTGGGVYTPMGVVTEVTDADLDMLMQNEAFTKGIRKMVFSLLTRKKLILKNTPLI